MSKLTLCELSNIVSISNQGQAQFSIQNVPDIRVQSNEHPIIFKVKANIVENIGVKPTYGILMHSGNQNKQKITVKYTGKLQELKKIKLQIRWMKLPRDLEAFNNEGKKVLYAQLYKECATKNEQKYEQITFLYKEILPQTESLQQFRYQSKIDEDQQERILLLQKKISRNSQKTQQKERFIITTKQVFFLTFLALLLGLSFGIRITRMQRKQLQSFKQKSNTFTNDSFIQF